MGRHKTVVEIDLNKDQEYFFEKMEKRSITLLSGKHIQNFVGETYRDSVRMAFEWVENLKTRKDKPQYNIKLVDYYPQIMGGKSILVSYNIEEK